ncbi:hypothetical protein [Synechococcus sp. PCC 6312]|uniref:hypothetical protein n=1 Tax=Synechococcus sp. (strain ATCC 27167 / PCC 6312) TaxID=195253 RepID=UPI00029F1A95|nr:hypothetical protein [Synechococcus sp. PCC 6312]AFY61939.1 hypothetical protein Syn6312_2875 [Synechococcus sp. PCC 6312]
MLELAIACGAVKVSEQNNAYVAFFKNFILARNFARFYPKARVAKSKKGNIYVAVEK